MSSIFGYLKPYKDELKLKHMNEYKNAYCVVCYGLRKNIGYFSTLFLNYEAVFLYIFLDGLSSDVPVETKFRCITNPLKKVFSKINLQLLEYTSFICYSLTLLKIIDNSRDSNKKLVYKLLEWLLSKNKRYLKLQQKYAGIDNEVKHLYDELYHLENNECRDFDLCSVTMGRVLAGIVEYYLNLQNIECVNAKEFAMHLGMWTYLIDAYDDYESDAKKGAFNPLYSFEHMQHGFTDINEKCYCNSPALLYAEMMLGMMSKNMADYIIKLKFRGNTEIIENIVCYGTINEVKKIRQVKNKRRKVK